MNLYAWLSPETVGNIMASVVVIVFALTVRVVAIKTVERHVERADARRRWVVSIRNWVLVVTILALGAIWGAALRAIAVGFVALIVAFLVAIKELIQCVSGSVLRTAAKAYSIGDRIQIGLHRGDVIDVNFFSTTILEVGPGESMHLRTGRTIVIPNSQLLIQTVVNESSMKGLVLHVFSVPMKAHEDWQRAQDLLLEAAIEECKPFVEPARSMMERLEREHGLEGIPLEPRVLVQMPEAGIIELLVRFPAAVGRQGRVEQAIMRRFLKAFELAR
jgi:small-conductance mechanosensitive channel